MCWRERHNSTGKSASCQVWDQLWGPMWWKERTDPKRCIMSWSKFGMWDTGHCMCQFLLVTHQPVRKSVDWLFMNGRNSFSWWWHFLLQSPQTQSRTPLLFPQAKEGWDSGREFMRVRIRSQKICFLPFRNFSSWPPKWELIGYLSLPHFWIRCQRISFRGELGKSGRK